MWGASRWTAGLLLLVVLAPVLGPLAMPCSALPQAQHCARQAMSAPAAQTAMPCHHAMAQSNRPKSEPSPVEASPFKSSESSFQATDNDCCQKHCCCGATTSEWAQPASSLISFVSILIEPARVSPSAVLLSSDIFGQDSARAPPRT
jgi:hypothetical protein